MSCCEEDIVIFNFFISSLGCSQDFCDRRFFVDKSQSCQMDLASTVFLQKIYNMNLTTDDVTADVFCSEEESKTAIKCKFVFANFQKKVTIVFARLILTKD